MRKLLCALALGLAVVPAIAGEIELQRGASLTCMTAETRGLAYRLADAVGGIEITSTCGGRHARGSAHYRGQAFDFRPLGASARSAVAFLKADSAVGAVIVERHGLIHADTRLRSEKRMHMVMTGRRRFVSFEAR